LSDRTRIEGGLALGSSRSRALTVLAVVAGLALLAPARAHAGAYRAALCNPELGAYHGDAAFERNSRRFSPETSCGTDGDGLVVHRRRGASRLGAWGAWVIRAPAGIAIEGLSVKAAGRRRGGHVPELLVDPATSKPFASPTGGLKPFRWSGAPAREFAARLRCRRRSGCASARGTRVRIKRIALRLDDGVDPTLRSDGSLFEAGSRRGTETIAPVGADVGGGIRRFLVQVNGEPVTAHTVGCRFANRIALRLEPCPARAGARFTAATASPPFRQGPNRVRICAADYATTTAANRACVRRRVRVDNLCPVSQLAGATLRATLRRRGRGATVRGRLVGRYGGGVPRARVCIAARTSLPGARERIVATPFTGEEGRFRASIPPGPSRQVRVAHWPGAARAVERYLDLDVPARPGLSIRPHHPVENGQRVRFRVRLPGPRSGGRRVRVQARAGRRWIDLRSGLTGAHGTFRAAYRFRATTGRRTYRFRAVVPKQRGYPYEAGRSKVRRVTVVG
jgi:hypothetical protein